MTLQIVTTSRDIHALHKALQANLNYPGLRTVATLGDVNIYAKLIRKNAKPRGFRGCILPVQFGFGNKFSELVHWQEATRFSGYAWMHEIDLAIEKIVADAKQTYDMAAPIVAEALTT